MTTIRHNKTFTENEATLRSFASVNTSKIEYKEKQINNQWWTKENNIYKIIKCKYNILYVCEKDNFTLSVCYDDNISGKEGFIKNCLRKLNGYRNNLYF